MKKLKLCLAFFALCSLSFAQNGSIDCISSAPGEDASRQMLVSWSADTTHSGSHVLYTRLTDRQWKRKTVVIPDENRRCDLFREVEGVVFNKCGATLDGLRPDTDYKYVVETENGVRSREGHFRTAGAKQWSAVLISDIHSTPRSPGRLSSAMNMIDLVENIDPSLDFVLSLGDVVSHSNSYSYWKTLFDESNFAEHMWARVNGNHDNWTKDCKTEERSLVPNHFYPATSYYPHNGYDGETGVCYHFRYGNAFFVMLNSEDMSKQNGELDAAKDWTRKVISEARSSACPPDFVVVCMHSNWFMGETGRALQYASWSKLFDETGVNLALAGNNHIYVRSKPLRDGRFDENGTVFLQTPSSDNDRGRFISDGTSENSDLIACRWTEGKKTVGAVHMEVDRKTMTLSLYDRSGNVVDVCSLSSD